MDPSAWDVFLHWIGQAQWGTVPTWFDGFSLLLAIFLFRRDRRRDDRALIDKVAIWPTVTYDQTFTALVDDYGMNLAHQAPEGAVRLDVVTAQVRWFRAIDNAGRHWEVRPGQGRRARRIRWYSRRREAHPVGWQHPIIRPLKVQLYKGRDAVRAWRTRRAQRSSR
jgi:hypothetical protein